ncbi:putative 1-phosphatidylinositol-3-phosphate 5-kinase FAB1C isoform X2 [Telopea speciosissima]|uniref:putative 1-phosphatidylinositol-3-phosphate 5-kinase FAB1C isoform X2 n=1 Tax=Telopea speciosissima TaxID=54955 RepID=UPI001CC7F406|nr:putative 1-phosphatidylinositol-3-phosphate 5-kinase FAB1C isoform X2 [Telopea speciosissima]
MGMPDSSFLDLIGKVRSWIPWSGIDLSGNSREVWMPDNGCRMCCECEMRLTEFSLRYHCQGCGRVLCGKCAQAIGTSVVSDVWGNTTKDWGERKYCKFCFEATVGHEAGRQHNDRIDHSSTQWSPEQAVPCLSGENNGKTFQSACLTRFLEADKHGSSPHAVATSSMESSSGNLSPVSFLFSSSRSDEEDGEDSGKHFFSPSSEYCQDVSDIDSSSVSARYEFYSVKSVGSSPLGSPYRMTCTPRAGYSVQQDQMGSPEYKNDASLGQVTMAVLRRPETESEDLETTDDCSDELSIFQDQCDKIQQPLDFENNVLIWFPPPADDEEDELENNFFEYDDEDDDVGESGAIFSSSSLNSDMFPIREKLHDEQKEPLRAVIHGHFRALVSQLLQGEGIHVGNDNDGERWLDIVTSVAWQAANFVKPDTSRGGSMDPGDYVKVKCIVSGSPSESTLIKGVVCTKNIKHKRMTSQYKNPRLLLLGGALEYQRVPNQLASLDTLLQQEIEHLKMVVSKIEVHRPNVLLVEKSVSSYAQEYLLAKEISLVLNVKKPLLERIARCTGALIVPSIDNLPKARLGHCEKFRLERVSEECTASSQSNKKSSKTLMFFEGCPRRLGCTVLLKGTCREELKKVKHVVQYAVFAAYHLSLETSFLADEGASLPKMPLKSPIAIPERMNTADHTISVISGSNVSTVCQELTIESQHVDACDPVGTSSYNPTLDVLSQNEGLTGPLTESESIHEHLSTGHISASSPCTIDPGVGMELPDSHSEHSAPHVAKQPCYQMQYDDLRDSDVLPFHIGSHSQHDLLETAVQENGMTLRNQMQLEGVPELMKSDVVDGNEVTREYFSAVDNHESILVSFSSCCVLKGKVCERSQLLRIKFYGSFDKPLGRFLRNDLFDQASFCRACNEPPEAHVLCYTHQQGNLTINVKSLPSLKLPGERDGKIWMWHRCLKCAHKDGVPPATRRVVMSDAAWGLSFGKFLELSFSNNATANRVASCGHSLQKDCLRFYGFGSMVAFFRYSPIDILSVHLPPSVLEFNSHIQQRWVQKEAVEVSKKKDYLYSEIFDVLQSIENKSTYVGHEPTDMAEFHNRVMELKELLSKEKNEYDSLLQPSSIWDQYPGQASVDILELNRLRRCLLIDSVVWDCQLCSLDSLLGTKSSISKLDSSTQEAATFSKLREWTNELRSDHEENKLEQLEEPNLQHHEPGSDRPAEMDSFTKLSVEGEHLVGLDLTSGPHHQPQDIQVDGVPVENTSLESLPSASNLSDKIDSAWTGTGQPPDGNLGGSVGLINQKNHPSFKRLMSPVRVYSFDSALRIQDKIRKGQSSSHLSSLRSYHASGDYRNVVRNPVAKMRRAYSHVLPREIKKVNIFNPSPLFISSASLLASEGVRLLLPQTGHNDIVVAVYDEEPTSVISYALVSKDYEEWMAKLDEHGGWSAIESNKEGADSTFSVWQSFGSLDSDDIRHRSYGSDDVSLTKGSLFSDPKRSPHVKISFEDESSSTGKAKFSVTCYFAKQFDALRKKCCPSEVNFIRSLSRCRGWSAQGGKSNVYFAKSLDERFVIKQVSKTELDSFEEFAPEYFKYLSNSLTSGSPTCLAKVLGIYQVTVKHLKGGRETKMDLMVMENLFFGRSISRVYDLKGSSRSRYNPDTTGKNSVLLDLNLLEALRTKPIFLGSKAKRSLERAVWNDTSFLGSVDVMDYSLLVGVDEERKELVLGIIDFMRQYTWDKHLETWVKASGILGGPKNASPTVISPKQYKKRFRKAMSTYFLTVPDQWSA